MYRNEEMELLKGLSMEELTALAEGGNAAAQVSLGDCYEYGLRGNKDMDSVKAFCWYEKAAGQNYAEGIASLAYMYYLGCGRHGAVVIPRDEAKAKELFLQAAETGSAFAKEKLKNYFPDEYAVKFSD